MTLAGKSPNRAPFPKSIMFVDDPPVWGGGQVMLQNYLDFANGMRRIVVRRLTAPEAPAALAAERLVHLDFPAWPPAFSRPDNLCRAAWPTLRTAWQLLRLIRQEKVEVIVANSFFALLPLFLARLVRPRPLIFVAHTTDIPQTAGGRLLLSSCTFVACCSQAANQALNSVASSKKRLLANANPVSPMPPPDGRIRQQLGWQNHWILGFIGRLSAEKNLSALIQAFNATASEQAATALLIVGDGPLRQPLESLAEKLNISDRVHFLGFVPDPRGILATLDALCLPSLRESFGLSVLQAQLAGVPTMGTPVGGIVELIDDDKTGILARDTSAAALSEAIGRLRQIGPSHPIVQAARQQAETDYSPERQRDQFLALLAESCAPACRG